jgi:hypothetical protein
MPWDTPLKKFIRENGRFVGPVVWNDDAVADVDVDSLGHDTHDQDIADGITQTLNIDGINEMMADLDVGTFKLVNVVAGTVATDGINKGQLDAVETQVNDNTAGLADAVEEAPIDGIAYNRRDAGWQEAAGGASVNDLITDQNWDGQIFTSTRANGNFTTNMELLVPDDFRSNGSIRHKGLVAATLIVPATGGRYLLTASTSQNLDFTLPTGVDAYLGEHYVVEGNILVTNTGISTITLQEDGVDVLAQDIRGTQPTASGERYTLTYIIHRLADDNYVSRYIWSA